jgi:hypothetical protein
MDETQLYGTSRERGANVAYPEVERVALEILASGHRPSVATVRARLGRGSAATLAAALNRFWKDLGLRAQNDPAALTRLPAEIIEAVEAIWQRALALAAQSAKSDHNAARERLDQIRIENEVRAQSFELRERAYETSARERERALADSRDHLLSTLRMLEKDRLTLSLRETRIAELEIQLAQGREQATRLMARWAKRRASPLNQKNRPGGRGAPKRPLRRVNKKTRPGPKARRARRS